MAEALDTAAGVRRVAMNLLARREHSRAELLHKLHARGAALAIIEPVLDRLAEQGFLNEARFLEAYLYSRIQAGYGPMRISVELKQRGLERAVISQALEDASINWNAQLTKLWQRTYAGCWPDTPQEYARQQRFLTYRGFSPESISRLLRQRTLE